MKMKKLLSLPPNLVGSFHELTGHTKDEYFCTNDPIGHKLGSGGGTAWLLEKCYEAESTDYPFEQWLAIERRILLHAGGQSRRPHTYPRVPLGARTASRTDPVRPAVAPL